MRSSCKQIYYFIVVLFYLWYKPKKNNYVLSLCCGISIEFNVHSMIASTWTKTKTYLIIYKLQWKKKSFRVSSFDFHFDHYLVSVIRCICIVFGLLNFTSKFVHKCLTNERTYRKKRRRKEKKNSICDSYRLYTMRSCIIAYAATVSNQYIWKYYIYSQRRMTTTTNIQQRLFESVASSAFIHCVRSFILFAGICLLETNKFLFKPLFQFSVKFNTLIYEDAFIRSFVNNFEFIQFHFCLYKWVSPKWYKESSVFI